MTKPLCMWLTANLGTCLDLARDLRAFDLDRPASRSGRKATIGGADDGISLSKLKYDLMLAATIDQGPTMRIKSAAFGPSPLSSPADHARALVPLLEGVGIHSEFHPDHARLALTDEAGRIVTVAGGAIAHDLGVTTITLCPPNPWDDGRVIVGDDRIPLPDEWRETLKALLPPLYAAGVETVGRIGDAICLGAYWQMCHAADDVLAAMRLHAAAGRREGA